MHGLMHTLLHTLRSDAGALLPLCARLSALWIASLWQGVAVVACAALLDRAMPRLAARLRHVLWLVACGVCALLPVADWAFSRMRADGAAGRAAGMAANRMTGAAAGRPGIAPLVLGDAWSCAVALLWAAGAVWAVARLLTGLIAVRSLLHHAAPAPSAALPPVIRAGSRGNVRILLSDDAGAPVATGYLRPAVVLPRALVDALTAEQMEQVLRHELEHLARRDDWTVLLAGCLGCALPLHPALAWARRKLAETREQACDDAVLRAASPRAYAMSLTQIAACASAQNRLRFLPGLLGERSQLAGRIEHILTAQAAPARSSRARLLLAVGTIAALTPALGQLPQFVSFQAKIATPGSAGPAQAHPVLPSAGNAAALKPVQAAIHQQGAHLTTAHLTAAHLAAAPLPAAPAAAQPAAARIESAAQRLRRRTTAARPHALLASAQAAPTPGSIPTPTTTLPLIPEQPAAIFLLWTPRHNELVPTLVFDFEPAPGSRGVDRQYFSFLEI